MHTLIKHRKKNNLFKLGNFVSHSRNIILLLTDETLLTNTSGVTNHIGFLPYTQVDLFSSQWVRSNILS